MDILTFVLWGIALPLTITTTGHCDIMKQRHINLFCNGCCRQLKPVIACEFLVSAGSTLPSVQIMDYSSSSDERRRFIGDLSNISSEGGVESVTHLSYRCGCWSLMQAGKIMIQCDENPTEC